MTSQNDLDSPPLTSQVGVGLIVPYDFALDRELWRWVPDDVTLHLTRTPHTELAVGLAQAAVVGDVDVVGQCARDLMAVAPGVVAYACTSGSFIEGEAGERALVAAMLDAGAPTAVTTSGALIEALTSLGARTVAIATPYDDAVTERLRDFLSAAGIEVVASRHLGLTGGIWQVPQATTAELVRGVLADVTDAGGGCDAVFVSCTNLATYDVIAPLERELGVPVLAANQVTLWAALREAGAAALGDGQRLLERSTR